MRVRVYLVFENDTVHISDIEKPYITRFVGLHYVHVIEIVFAPSRLVTSSLSMLESVTQT